MGLKVHTETKEQQAHLMAQPDIKFVSLVGNAANREPFRVVKNDSVGGENMAGAAVQRLIAPAGSDIVAILKEEGIDFQGEVSVAAKSTIEGYDVYTQAGIEKFDPTSFGLVVMTSKSDKSVSAVVGKLKTEHKSDSVLTIKSDLSSPLDTTVVSMNVEDTYYGMYISTTTAAEALDNQSWNLYRGIGSIASAAGMDSKARLKTMLAMVDGFRNFLSTLMAFVDDATTESKSDGTKNTNNAPFIMPIMEQVMAAGITVKHEDIDMKPEEIAEIASKSALEAVKQFMADTKKSEEATAMLAKASADEEMVKTLTAEKADLTAKLADAEAKLEALTTEKADLEKKIADLDLSPETTQKGDTTHKAEPAATKKAPVTIGCFKSDLSAFNGMFKVTRK